MKVGFIGWRGMVGSVLMDRMIKEGDFNYIDATFFSTSNAGGDGPDVGKGTTKLLDAENIKQLSDMDVLVSCQGGDYTKQVFPELRNSGWKGYWVDAASSLRMDKDSIIILDPVNMPVIKKGLKDGIKNFIGGNCTVSLALMAIGVLFQKDLVEWMSTMTYQAASGAGAKNMRELILQMGSIWQASKSLAENPAGAILELDKTVQKTINDASFPIENFGAPLAGSLIPWIDSQVENGQTREEWKGYAETNKILNTKNPIPIDGLCVRVGAMRSHSQALTIKLKKDAPLDEIIDMIKNSNEWVKVVDNNKPDTLKFLSPAAISGTLTIPVGRIHKMMMGPEYLTAFTVGDQLLWGAAEPLRRMIKILLDK
ncbi:MAG TPA: aspartate-semialdehyde dehydrogenase [Spirochaetota bacterium]|nr:MAG: Aspartate-semialdehyde dehydrogenase [Spirochaetes bacterium ADurb.Bin133]HOF02136.1 aspartate-semialdehyde dehydrogenase [Spirochaetota bacterium]HOS33909.1 aspartate-semialdehyde dehydrogenase [Spirochaetota bacterium]HOS56877.1 aspartate-semialdehyde dehydrogenase [Spirochaetota bacterium]HPY88727.1 aspartate-semialdehyde dehydrogenase [Spirochaetota bacterium]